MGKKKMDINEQMEVLTALELDDLSSAEQMLFVLALMNFLKSIEPILSKHKGKVKPKEEPESSDDPITRMILEGIKKAIEDNDGEDN